MSDCSLPPIPRGTRYREGPLASVQRGYEEDAVLVLKLVVQLTLVQERNEETVRGTFPLSFPFPSQGGGLTALGEIESSRKKGTLYVNLKISRMEESSPLPPATHSFLTRGGTLVQPQLGGQSGREDHPATRSGPDEGQDFPTKSVKGGAEGWMSPRY